MAEVETEKWGCGKLDEMVGVKKMAIRREEYIADVISETRKKERRDAILVVVAEMRARKGDRRKMGEKTRGCKRKRSVGGTGKFGEGKAAKWTTETIWREREEVLNTMWK